MNTNLKKGLNKYKLVLGIIIISQIVFLLVANIIIGNFLVEFEAGNETAQLIKNSITIILLIIDIVVDIIFYVKNIYRLNSMLSVEPRKCIIEDFIIYPYGYSERNGMSKKDYRISPLVRDITTGELYFTYYDYDISYYNSTSTYNGRTIINKTIFRKDGSEVKIGDTAVYYIRQKVNVDVVLDKDNNIVKLNNKKMSFIHYNENIDINIFNRIIFFEGVIEVENILEY